MFGIFNLARYAFELTDRGSLKLLQAFTFTAHNAGRETEKFERTTRNLTVAMTSLGGVLTVRQLIEYADAWTLINSRVKIVTESQEQAMQVQQRLYEISQRSRNQLSATAVLYTRLAINADQLGRSQEDLLNVVEAVNNAVLVSGATGVEAAQSIRQLAQAFGKGKLDGDEFRTVMEAMPLVQRAIADEMGVPIGSLQQLAAQGKISANTMIDAMLNAQKKLEEQAKNMQWTLGQSYTILRNSLTRMIGIINMGYGASAKFSDGMRWMADNMEKVIAIIPTVISLFIGYRTTLMAVAITQAIVTSQETIRGFYQLASAVKAMAIAAFTASQAYKGWVALIGLVVTTGAGILVYKKTVQEITEMMEKWASAQSDLTEKMGEFTPPPDPKAEKARQATEDMMRQAAQSVMLATREGVEQKRLKADYAAVNKEIEARRDLFGDALAERLAAIDMERRAAHLAIDVEIEKDIIQEELQEKERIIKKFLRNIQTAFADMLYDIFQSGIDSFKDFFLAVKDMFLRLLAEMASAKIMAKVTEPLSQFLTEQFGMTSREREARERLEAQRKYIEREFGVQTGHEQYMADMTERERERVRREFEEKTGEKWDDATVIKADVVAMEDSAAKVFAKHLGVAFASFMVGNVVGGMTTNKWLGAAGGAMSGALTGAYLGSAVPVVGTLVGGIIGGLSGALGGLMGAADRAAEEARQLREQMSRLALMLEQNSQKLEEMRRAFQGRENEWIKDVLAAPAVLHRLQAWGSDQRTAVPKWSTIDAQDRAVMLAAAQRLGIEILDENGELVTAALIQLIEAVKETIHQMTNFGNNLTDIKSKQEAYNAIFEIEDTPMQRVMDSFNILSQMAPQLMDAFGLAGLDPSDPEARKIIMEGFKDIFNLIMSGGLTLDLLGSFTDKNALLDAIIAVTESFKDLNKELYDVVTDFPRVMDIAYYEQLYGKYGLEDEDTSGKGAATGAPDTYRTGGGDSWVVNGGVTIINQGTESGEELLDKIETEARRRHSRGGYIYTQGREVY